MAPPIDNNRKAATANTAIPASRHRLSGVALSMIPSLPLTLANMSSRGATLMDSAIRVSVAGRVAGQ